MMLKMMAGLSLLLAVITGVSSTIWLLPVYFAGYFLALLVLAVAFLLIAVGIVDQDKPQTGDSVFYRALARHYLQLIVRLAGLKIHTTGTEKLPTEGRFVLVCNHINDLDPAMLLHCFPNSGLSFISKKENRDMPIIGALMHKLNCQLIDRENDREALKTILKCIQMIKDDQASVAVFPEGYVSLDGRLRHFRSGVLKIAQKAGVPIVVCTIQGTKQVLSNLKKCKRSQVDVHLVDVISAEQVKSVPTTELSEMIYEMMIADMGEQYRCDEKAVHPDQQRKMAEQA